MTNHLTKNVGRYDQAIRFFFSLFMIYIGFIDEQFITDLLITNIIGVIGIVNLIVSFTRVCPLYILTDINTCKDEEK